MFEQLIWLVPLSVAAAGLWRPRAAILALAASLPLFGSPPGGPYLPALDVAVMATILAGVRAPRQPPTSLRWPILAFAACALTSLLPFAYTPPAWSPAVLGDLVVALPGVETGSLLYTWRAAFNLLLGLGLFWSARRSIDRHSLRELGLALAGGLVFVELIGFADYLGWIDLGGYRSLAADRLHSLFFNSGWLAEYVAVVAPIAVAALLVGGRWSRLAGQAVAALSLAAILFSQQRGGWLTVLVELAALGVAWGLLRSSSRGFWTVLARAAAGLAVVTIATAVLAPQTLNALRERGRHVTSNLGVRTHYWGTALELTRERPVQGWGLGTFSPAYDRLRPPGSPGARKNRGSAHSLYLHSLAEQGVVGLAALLLVLVALIRSLSVALRRSRAGPSTLAIGLAIAFLGFFVYGAVQYMFHLGSITMLFWLLLAAAANLSSSRPSRWLDRAAGCLVAVALLLMPYRLLAVEPMGGQSNRTFGFHATEGRRARAFQWAEGRAARRLERQGETLVLELANGHPKAAEHPVEVTVLIDGREVERLEIRGGWETHRVRLAPSSDGWLVLGLRSRPTFRPFSAFRGLEGVPPSNDIRSLAVAVREPRFE